ncbi:MAG: S-layer protein domain-containing protein, partial [Candidatus Methanoperedens sp.]|nr:S-layer protein domain-containing protein [Candidatus Methanoperedens sp.]
PRQAWLVLSKDGVKKDDKVIAQGGVYTYIEKSFAGETDVPLFVTYVDSVFAGATSDMVQLRYTWAIGTSVTEVKSADVFGNMEVTSAGADTLVLKNKDKSVDLTQDGTVDIMGEMKFRVADSATDLRYYPVVDYQIGAGPGPTGTGVTVTGSVTPTGTGMKPTGNATVAATVVETTAPAVTETAKPAAATATPKEPGFQAVFAIAGLLAVAYLVLRQRK